MSGDQGKNDRRSPMAAVAGFRLAALLLAPRVFAAEGPLVEDTADQREFGGIEYKPSLVLGYDAEWEGENPTSIDVDLDSSFPQRGALFETNIPKAWFKWKGDLYTKAGIKLGSVINPSIRRRQTVFPTRTPRGSAGR